MSHVTVTVSSVAPTMLLAALWLEYASCVLVHASATQAVRPEKVPSAWHVAVRAAPLEYPASHISVTVAPVTPVMLFAVP